MEPDLGQQRFDLAVRGQGEDPISIRMPGDHVEGANPIDPVEPRTVMDCMFGVVMRVANSLSVWGARPGSGGCVVSATGP